MDPYIGGSLIQAGGQLLGSLMGNGQRFDGRPQARAWKYTKLLNNRQWDQTQKLTEINFQNSKKFAKNSVRWLAEDARRSGIHPLAAMGAAGAGGGYVPAGSMQGSSVMPPAGESSYAGSSIGDGIANAAAAVGNAVAGNAIEKAEIGRINSETERNKAEAAAILAEATSRTTIERARRAAAGGTVGAPSTATGENYNPGQYAGERPIVKEPGRDISAAIRVGAGKSTSVGLNEEAFSVGIDEFLLGMLIHGPQWAWDWADSRIRKPLEQKRESGDAPSRQPLPGNVPRDFLKGD